MPLRVRKWAIIVGLVGAVGLPLSGFILGAWAQQGCVPNPNASGLPFVNGCPYVASGFNTLVGIFGTPIAGHVPIFRMGAKGTWLLQDSGAALGAGGIAPEEQIFTQPKFIWAGPH